MLYELQSVTKRYQRGKKPIAALDNIDLKIDEGELLALQGSTGSGKTTLLQMLGALDRPTSGSARIRRHRSGVDRRTRIDQVAQPRLRFYLPELQPDSHVDCAAERRDGAGASRRARERALTRARAALDEVGLGRSCPSLAGRIVRRRAAARCYRPGAGLQAARDSRRRTDRQPRRTYTRRDHRLTRRIVARPATDDRHGHT